MSDAAKPICNLCGERIKGDAKHPVPRSRPQEVLPPVEAGDPFPSTDGTVRGEVVSKWFDPHDSDGLVLADIRELLYILVVGEATADRAAVEEGLQDFRDKRMKEQTR